MRTRERYTIVVLVSVLILTMIFSAGLGARHITPTQIISMLFSGTGLGTADGFTPGQEHVFWAIRSPRVVLGILIGAALAVSGASMQGLFRNPLADPGLIGISAGASLSAVITIVLISNLDIAEKLQGTLGYYTLNITTFLGACITTIMVYTFSRNGDRPVISTMLLTGIAINALCGAMTGLITYYATDSELRSITFWSLGSLGSASWNTILALLPFILIPLCLLPRTSKQLNALALGESEADLMGVNVNRLKVTIIVLATMAVGASVAVAGMIGFIGLVIPHLLRLFVGPDNRFLLIASSIAGAILLTMSDVVSRTLVAPAELPIGIITAMIGTPVFIWILVVHKRQLSLQ